MPIRLEKIKFFESILLDFFRKAGREELPWRKRGITAYEVWVSEIMLQQTQVSRVIGYYTRFLERFPNIESLAQASWEDFLPYYEGLGYYARGRNMLRAGQAIVNEYGGTFPRHLETLQTIPGIGPYTAAAIMSDTTQPSAVRLAAARLILSERAALVNEVDIMRRIDDLERALNEVH